MPHDHIRRRLATRLDGAELIAALARLEAGTYGCCEVCRDAIGYHRLYEEPGAVLCERCAIDDTGVRPRSPRTRRE